MKNSRTIKDIDRSSKIYKEIEEFEEYERTPCITFEMAIRNDLFKEVVRDLYERYTIAHNENSESIEHYGPLERALQQVGILPEYMGTPEERKAHINDFLYMAKRIGCSVDKEAITKFSSFKHEDFDDGVVTVGNVRDGYVSISKKHQLSTDLYPSMYVDPKDYYGVYIKRHFRRPILYSAPKYRKTALVELDFSLPINELLNYLKHIQKDIEYSKENILLAPIEVFSENIQKANNISKLCIQNKNGKEECFDSRNGELQSKKLADLFYIYDCYKMGVDIMHIRMNLLNYHERNETNINASYNSVKKAEKIIVEYIDKEKYHELITGLTDDILDDRYNTIKSFIDNPY